MIETSSVSIVIPVYNEEDNLETLYQELCAVSQSLDRISFEFIFVDDGSCDRSSRWLHLFASVDPRVKVVFFPRNFGQTAAMSCGIKFARGNVIIPLDADLQNDPVDIPRFLEKINEGYSCVSGWRKDRKDSVLLRKIPSWTANVIISWMTGVYLHDYGCSMKAYQRDMIQGVELYGEMHRFIPAYVAWQGAKITEIVVHHRARIHGVSNYGISRVFKVILDLIVVKFLVHWFNRPMHFFGAVGFVSFFLGCVVEFSAILYKLFGHKDFVQTPLPEIGAMFIIVGVQCILFGLIAEVLMRTYYEGQHKTPWQVREILNG